MSKFIRTENRIYEVNNDVYVENDEAFMRWFRDGKELESDNLGKVISQADTIEELCDALVYYDCDLECMQVIWLKGKNVANFKRYFDYVKTGHIKDVKGAILTDKGIIYVANMNDKGDLELI